MENLSINMLSTVYDPDPNIRFFSLLTTLIPLAILLVIYILLITKSRLRFKSTLFKVGLGITLLANIFIGIVILIIDFILQKTDKTKGNNVKSIKDSNLAMACPEKTLFSIIEANVSCLGFEKEKSKRLTQLVYDNLRPVLDDEEFSLYAAEKSSWATLENILSSEDSELNREAIKICEEHIEKE